MQVMEMHHDGYDRIRHSGNFDLPDLLEKFSQEF